MLVSQGPWWWIRVLPPGAVVTIEEYRFVEPATGAETPMARSIAAFWPVPTTNSEGWMRRAIRGWYRHPRPCREGYDPGDVRTKRDPARAAARPSAGRADTPSPAAATDGGPRGARRDLDQARGPRPAFLLGQQAAQPRV